MAAATPADGAPTAAAAAAVDAAEARTRAADMLSFINAAWTPYHAVAEAATRLRAAGFQHIAERDAWSLQPGAVSPCMRARTQHTTNAVASLTTLPSATATRHPLQPA